MDIAEPGNLAPPVHSYRVSGLFWKLNRLRAMSFLEIVHRTLRWGLQQVEKALLICGWSPAPAHPVKPKLSLFLPTKDWVAAWQQHYCFDQSQIDELLQGKIGFFGHPPLDVGVPVNWHRDPLTGIEAPLAFGKELNYRDDKLVGNIKVVWELGRHQHLIPLAVAYACTGNADYREAVVAQIEGWIDDNPYAMGIHWCSALEVSLRLTSWAVVHSLFTLRDGDGGLFSAVKNPFGLGRTIYQQAWFVRHFLSRYSSANNHLIGEFTGLWVACSVFDMGKQGEYWAEKARQGLEREACLQVHEDGVHKEQSCYYHLWVLEYLLFAWVVGLRSGRNYSETFCNRILTMASFLRAITPAGGVPPQIGDADDGFLTRFDISWPENAFRDVLSAVDVVFENRAIARPLPQKVFWYALCLGKTPQVSEKISEKDKSYPALFKKGGYAILGKEGLHLLFDAGQLGYPAIAAHGHADALNVCLALDGEWWLVDPGTYAYHSEHGWRDYFRGTAAHNTIRVNNLNQSQIGGPFLWLRHAQARLVGSGVEKNGNQWAVGEHDGYKKIGGVHVRRVELDDVGNKVTVFDEVRGSVEHELGIYFHFAPDIEVVPGDQRGTWQATKSGTARKMLMVVDESWCWRLVRGSVSPKLGWYSPALGIKVPTCTLFGIWRGRLPVKVVTRMIVY